MGMTWMQRSAEDLLESQWRLMQTLSIMMHHDAITGTHMHAVGRDYQDMMERAKSLSLKKSMTDNGATHELLSINAVSHGFVIKTLDACDLDGLTIFCEKLRPYKTQKSFLISLYNPNLQPNKGLFLRVQKDLLGLSVKIPREDLPKGTMMSSYFFDSIETEAFCF